MFKDKYTRDNEKIIPEESAVRYIKNRISREKMQKNINYNAILATALAVCLALGVVFISSPKKPEAPSFDEPLVTGISYDDIFNSLSSVIDQNKNANGYFDGAEALGVLTIDDAAREYAQKDSATGTKEEGDSSTTNNQVAGVDEADIVKNDGKYIYILRSNKITICEANKGAPVVVSTTNLAYANTFCHNIFVEGDRLAVLHTSYKDGDKTGITIYNIADRSQPLVMTSVTQDGYFYDARMIDGTVYLLSNHFVYDSNIRKEVPADYIPCINGRTIPLQDISLINEFKNPAYLVISATDISTAQNKTSEAVLGGAENIYCNADHLYYTFTKTQEIAENQTKTTTHIVKLALNKEDVKTLCSGTVDGTPLNQFSMDEYEGNLRIVTTIRRGTQTKHNDASQSYYSYSQTTDNALYILDSNLEMLSSLENLAYDERVYSVRFDGEIGYFVTFRDTDPLFTVDLSDSKNPKILSELKIPGFSEYLHPFGEDLLFGFGKSVDDKTAIDGVKLSMFDVSDRENVFEADTEKLPALWSEASYNHKAIMVDYKKNIIAFAADGERNSTYLYVYGYGDDGFFQKHAAPIEGIKYFANARFVYIGDWFYLTTDSSITSFSITTFEKVSHIDF